MKPLYPMDGMEYFKAMDAAQAEYDAWVQGNKTLKRIQVYSRVEHELPEDR